MRKLIFRAYFDDEFDHNSPQKRENCREELNTCLNMNRIDKSSDILKWCQCHIKQLPILSKMARDILSIQVTFYNC